MKKNTVLTVERDTFVPADMEQDAILHMRIARDMLKKLDELRKREDDLPSRSEMVRRLIDRATDDGKVKPRR